MKCRGCSSEFNFIRDCPKIKKSVLVNIVVSGSLPVASSAVQAMTIDQIADSFQNLSDEVWEEYESQILLSETVENEPAPTSSAMVTFLHDCAGFHEDFSGKLDNINSSWIEQPATVFNINHATPVFIKSANPISSLLLMALNLILQTKVKELVYNGNLKLEGVMLDNAAARSPSGLPAYLRYCAFSGIEPLLRESNRIFKGMGQWTTPSLGIAEVRLPIRSSLALTFDAGIVDHEVPILFGLELHKRFKCSSNEVEYTFTHHPTSTSIPVIFSSRSEEQGSHLFLT